MSCALNDVKGGLTLLTLIVNELGDNSISKLLKVYNVS